MRTRILLLFTVVVLCSSPAFSQVESITAHVKDVQSAITFNLALVSLREIAGVESVSGDMQSGRFEIRVKPAKGVRIRDIQNSLRVAGEKSELEFSARGTLEKRGNRVVLVIPKQQELFIVEGGAKSQMASNLASQNHKVKTAGKLSGNGNQFKLQLSTLEKK